MKLSTITNTIILRTHCIYVNTDKMKILKKNCVIYRYLKFLFIVFCFGLCFDKMLKSQL